MALVVTIVVIIILASVSINATFGENGIIKKAQEVKDIQSNSVVTEEEEANYLLAEYANMMYEPPAPPTGPNGKQLVSSITTTDHDTITGEDAKGNQVVIPGGFKLASDSGTTVQQGIVIEDSSGNQFVWIPVSNTNGDGSNKIILDDGSEVEITLGRYTFNTSTGEETIGQYASNYASTVTIESFFQELSTFSETYNTTAKDLAGFVSSVSSNKGYYFARYEASCASGSTFGVGENSTYYKPASKVSTAYSEDSMSYTAGTLWNFITQGNASKVCRQMYYGNSYVESDLVNSYAWDTAIVYIQKMGNSNYANQIPITDSLTNTGSSTNNDQKCKIYDMAGNLSEWTTEYSTDTGSDDSNCCTIRGGYSGWSDSYTRIRFTGSTTASISLFGFRPVIYVK